MFLNWVGQNCSYKFIGVGQFLFPPKIWTKIFSRFFCETMIRMDEIRSQITYLYHVNLNYHMITNKQSGILPTCVNRLVQET